MRVPAALFLSAFLFCLVSFCRADTPPVQDIFVGSGTPGPFALHWNNVEANTETVSVNGQPQLRSIDYALDSGAGTVMFTHSVPVNSAVSVSYEIVPGQSQHSGGGQTIPLSVDLLRNGNGYFSLDALGKAADAASNLTLGAGFGWGGPSSRFSSRFVYTPEMASSTDGHADRTGLSLGGSTQAGRWGQFSLGLSRAGAGLDTSAGAGFQAGRQVLTLGSTLTPTKMIQAQLSFSRSDPMTQTGTAADDSRTQSSLALTLTPSDNTKVSANVSEAETGNSGTTQNVALSVNTQAAKTLNVTAGYSSQDQPGTASDREAISLKTILTPGKTYSVQASADQSKLGMATTNQQSVTLALTPQSNLRLQAGFALRQKSADGSPDMLGTSEATVGGTLRPLSVLEVSGTYKSRMAPGTDTNDADLLDTSTAQVAFAPIKTFKLTGTYAQNPDDGGDTLQRIARRGLGLETRFGALGLSGGCDWSRTDGTPDVEQTIHANLGLRFSAATLLSVGYQTQQNRLDPAVPLATAYTVGFTHTLGDRFSLSLSGKRQQAATAEATPDYKATASLGMKF